MPLTVLLNAAITLWCRRRIASAYAELEACAAQHPPDPALEAEMATWTDEQVNAAIAGLPLGLVRAMQPAAKPS